MHNNHLVAYQQLPENIRRQIYENYFAGRKQFNNFEKPFHRYMHQQYIQNIIQSEMAKTFFFKCYKPNGTQELGDPSLQQIFPQSQDFYYLMGSLKSLRYFNENNEQKELIVCDLINQYLCPLHFEIRLPQISDASQLQSLDNDFQNTYLMGKYKQKIDQLNYGQVLIRDISGQPYQTYLMNANVVKLDEQNLFAFELQKELNWIRYFSVKNNKKRYFFDDENTDFPLIFVVGTEDQENINNNVFNFWDSDENNQNRNDIKKLLQYKQIDLQQLTNAIRISISLCDFDLIVHPNENNNYTLKVNNQTYPNIFDDDDFLQSTDLYEAILQQLKFENDEWTLNLNKQNYTFYSQANHYPDHFYLATGQTAIIRCPTANVKFSQNPDGQSDNNQQQQQ